MRVLVGPYTEPIATDVVGYIGNGNFVILAPAKKNDRNITPDPVPACADQPLCLKTTIRNRQIVKFQNVAATLWQVGSEWYYQFEGEFSKHLHPNTFFEMGDVQT